MTEVRRGYPSSNIDKALGGGFLIAGTVALGVTFLASRGSNHSEIHKKIAKVAYLPEVITTIAGAGLIKADNKTASLVFKTAGITGLGITSLCFGAVAWTDEPLRTFFEEIKGPNKIQAISNLGKNKYSAFKRHLLMGIQFYLH